MEDKKSVFEKINKLNNGEYCNFNMFQEGGAVVYKCNYMYLLFEIPTYGGDERYEGTYFENQKNDMINEAFTWT